jgi:uncharacterized membrane protein
MIKQAVAGAFFGLVIGLTRFYPHWRLDASEIGEVVGMMIGCALLYTLASKYWPKK